MQHTMAPTIFYREIVILLQLVCKVIQGQSVHFLFLRANIVKDVVTYSKEVFHIFLQPRMDVFMPFLLTSL